jgi:hypothetical protein
VKIRPPDELSTDDANYKPVPTDIQLYVRDGMVCLRVPDHDKDTLVPEDYLVALGFSMAFGDPMFRRMMKALVEKAHEDGALGAVLTDVVTTRSTIN